MNRSQPTAAELRVLRADAARVREQQPTADVVTLQVPVERAERTERVSA